MTDDLDRGQRVHHDRRRGGRDVAPESPRASQRRAKVRLAQPRAVPLPEEQRRAAVAALAVLLAPLVPAEPACRPAAAPAEDDHG